MLADLVNGSVSHLYGQHIPNLDPGDPRKKLLDDIRKFLTNELPKVVSYAYSGDVISRIISDVMEDVEESSDFRTGGNWNDDDIRLAVGRVLLDRL